MKSRMIVFQKNPLCSGTGLAACTLVGLIISLLSGCGQSPSPAEAPAQSNSEVDSASSMTKALTTPVLESPPASSGPTGTAPQAQARARELVTLLSSPGTDLNQWEQAHAELLALGADAVPVLVTTLHNGNDMERELAATTLVLLGPNADQAVSALQNALQDPQLFVRANAAAALVQIPGASASAVPTLIALLNESDPQIRQLAAVNLGALGPDAQPYVNNLKQVLTRENSPEVLTPVVELLGRIGPPAEAAVPELQKIAFEQPGEVADAATHAIQQITSP